MRTWPTPKEMCWDSWQFIRRSDTFPQKQVGQLWDTTFGKITAVFGLSSLMDDWPVIEHLLAPINALTDFLIAAAAWYGRN